MNSAPPLIEAKQAVGLSPRVLWLLLALAAAAGLAVLFFFDPAAHRLYPGCTFYRATGLLCPGCGSTRALHQLLHGEVAAAFRFNALLVVGLPVTAAFLAVRRLWPALRLRSAWLWMALILVFAFGILRNLPVAASLGLAPW